MIFAERQSATITLIRVHDFDYTAAGELPLFEGIIISVRSSLYFGTDKNYNKPF